MARHAEESRDDLQAMKALNVFYQVCFDPSGIASFEILWLSIYCKKLTYWT